jgi:hypothetical protein
MPPVGRVTFRVIWGDPFRGITQELVEAFDAEEALVIAHERRPELARPRAAFMVGESPRLHFPR